MSLAELTSLCKTRKIWSGVLLGIAAFVLAQVLAISPGWSSGIPTLADDLDLDSLRHALRQSLRYLERIPPDRVVGEQPRRFTAGEVTRTLVAFEKLLVHWPCRECWMREFNARFELIPSSPEAETAPVLFTGYYQPVISASLVPSAEYAYPIYGKPDDLIVAEQVIPPSRTAKKNVGRLDAKKLVPYYSRQEIDELGSLRGKGYEIAWVNDPVEVFFLHIQGSGVLQLPDGSRMNVGYVGRNGRPYRSIGKLLIDRGKIPKDEMSMQRLKRYLREHPRERNEILFHNESYVFFRFVGEGPLGHLEVPLTAGRSIATDSRLFPRGALAFVSTERPVVDGSGEVTRWLAFSRFVLNQDTGSAIVGPRRVDLYFGAGHQAGAAAGWMNRPGKLYFLALRGAERGGKTLEYGSDGVME